MKKRSFYAALLITSGLTTLPAIAHAQSAAEESEPGVGEIVVTANRVETKAQDTPITLNAYTGSELAAQGVTQIDMHQVSQPDFAEISITDQLDKISILEQIFHK